MPIISLFIEGNIPLIFQKDTKKMLEKLNQLRLCPAVSTFTEAKEWIAIFEGPSEWFETEKEFENYAEKRKIENHASAEEVKAARTTF